MSAPGAFATTSDRPMATEQISTNACDALGELASDIPAGDFGLACLRGRR